MKEEIMGRRSFLRYAAAVTAGTGLLCELGCDHRQKPLGDSSLGRSRLKRAKLRKSLQLGMLPQELSDADKFKLAKKCGFDGIEASPMEDLDAARRLGRSARQAGVPIHSIVYGGWGAPFSDPDPKVIEKGLAGMETACAAQKHWAPIRFYWCQQ